MVLDEESLRVEPLRDACHATPPTGTVRVDEGTALTLTGVGAMNSPRFRPAGRLVVVGGHRVVIDGGCDVVRTHRPDAWLVATSMAS